MACATPFLLEVRRRKRPGLVADLVNVFEVFLPQLLLYPNPSDPLNGEAAALMLREPDTYKAKIRGARPLLSLLLGAFARPSSGRLHLH